jgi:hypothetical protein
VSKPRCDTCRFFERGGSGFGPGTAEGYCHRFPPTSIWGFYPITGEGYWCGEYQVGSGNQATNAERADTTRRIEAPK